MILARIKSLRNSAEIEMAFPTSRTVIRDAYEILGAENPEGHEVKYLDCEYELPEYESGNSAIPLEKLGGRHPALEELNCLVISLSL